MKTSTWLGFFSAAAVAVLAWFSHQPDTARATPAPAVATAQVLPSAAPAMPDAMPPYSDLGFHAAETVLSPSARAGREIWFKATAGNARFHTYTFQQRITALIDW